MKELKQINFLNEIYKKSYLKIETCKELLNRIKYEKNPWGFKQEILGIIQLYFDGLIKNEFKFYQNNKKLKTLEELCLAGKNYIGKFYKGEGKDMGQEKEIILSNEKDILKRSSGAYLNPSHLINKEDNIINSIPFLEEKLTEYLKNNKIETIVPITSEGFEPSFLI